MTGSGRTTRPPRATSRCTRSMNGHILHRFVAGRGSFSSHQPIPDTARRAGAKPR